MPVRTNYRMLPTGRLFPRESELGRCMLALLVIRADLRFEIGLIGTADERVRVMTESRNSATQFHARAYFFRGTLRSMYSARPMLDWAMGIAEFRALLHGAGRRDEFTALLGQIHVAANEFEGLRNDFGAHAERTVANVRDILEDERLMGLEWDDQVGWTPRIAGNVIAALISGDHPTENDAAEATRARFERMRDAGVATLKALDLVADLYLGRFTRSRR